MLTYIQNIFKKPKPKENYIFYISIAFITLISRLPFITKYLFEWDSIQLALGIRKFNILLHQPHPPGYFFYVYLSKLINLIVHNPNYSMIIINIIFTIIGGIIFFKISQEIFKNKILSLLSALIFLFNPFIWFHGEFANIYAIDFVFSLIFFYLTCLIIKKKKNLLPLYSFLFALGIGFRQSILIFFTPLYIYSFYFYIKHQKKPIPDIIKNFGILIITSLAWLIPTAYLSGGLFQFFKITLNQYSGAVASTSIFSLSKISAVFKQSINALKIIIYSGNILSFLIILNFIKKKFKFNKITKIILLLWFLPSFIFYCFIHLGKIGYIMTIVPLIIFLGILAINKIKKTKKKYLIMLCVILIQIILFVFDIDSFLENKLSNKFLVNVAPYKINIQNLKNNDLKLKTIIDFIKKYNPKDTILICEGDSPYYKLRTNFIKSARHLNYYLPQYYIYYLFNDKKTATKYYRYYGSGGELLYQWYIPIDQKIKNVILITDDFNYEIYDFKYTGHYIDENIFYKDVSGLNSFEYLEYQFVKQP